MCDPIEGAPGTGWKGWTSGDSVRSATPAGEWIDLTWPLSPSVPRLGSFPPPRVERVASMPDDPLNVTELSMVVHVGTHVDSPRHFFRDGPALEDVPLSRLMGTGGPRANAPSTRGRGHSGARYGSRAVRGYLGLRPPRGTVG